MKFRITTTALLASLALAAQNSTEPHPALASFKLIDDDDCSLITHETLRRALNRVMCGKDEPCPAQLDPAFVAEQSGGLGNNMWAAVVNRAGRICAVAFSGTEVTDQWLASRTIAAQKAYTANALSLDSFSLGTAHLWAGTQPGGPMWGIVNTMPVHVGLANTGKVMDFGTPCEFSHNVAQHAAHRAGGDPLCGMRIGGAVTFGGGLALYDATHKLVGGLGISGDLSCADNNIAWRLRHELQLDYVTAGPNTKAGYADNIIYDEKNDFGHARCNKLAKQVAEHNLPATR